MSRSMPTCLITILLSGFAAPTMSWGQSSVDKEVEMEFWRSIKDSDDPAMVNAYLEQYPNGTFSSLANIKIKKLEEAAEAAGALPTGTTESDAEAIEPLPEPSEPSEPAGKPRFQSAAVSPLKVSDEDPLAGAKNRLETPEVPNVSGCPAGTKQTYKGCEADSSALAAAVEAALKAVELSQSANTAEEKAAAKAAAEQAANQLAEMKAAGEARIVC